MKEEVAMRKKRREFLSTDGSPVARGKVARAMCPCAARVAVWLAVAVYLTGTAVLAVSSDTVFVDANERSRHWMTLYTNAVPLAWNWKTNATHANLEIVGMSNTVSTNFTLSVSNWVWQAFETASPVAEDVYDLTLTFYDDSETVVEELTSRLAVVKGAFRNAAVNADAASAAWTKVKADVVIPYDAVWGTDAATNAVSAQLVIAKVGGAIQTNAFEDVAGYAGWKLRNSSWGCGTFDLSLAFAGSTNAWAAERIRLLYGTAIIMR